MYFLLTNILSTGVNPTICSIAGPCKKETIGLRGCFVVLYLETLQFEQHLYLVCPTFQRKAEGLFISVSRG